jgi:hypothetical protein
MTKTTNTKKTATKATTTKTAGKAAPKTVNTKAKATVKPKAKAGAAKIAKPIKRVANSDIVRPTRNKTAYMMFVKEQRKATQDANPDMGFVEITKDIAERWGKLSATQLKPFQASAAQDKVRYEKEVTEFRANHPDEPLTIKKKKRVAKLKGPKKARSAYVFYTTERRSDVQAKNPKLEFGDVTKHIAEEWNKMSDNQKAKYEVQAKADKIRFEAENDEFNSAHPEVKKRKLKAKKSQPKKARSAYLFYTMEKRTDFKNANPDKSFGDLTKLVADDWSKISAAQKKKFEKLADEDRKRYEQEMSNYVRPTDDELDAQIAAEPKKKAKKEGPKRPRSAYLFYTTSERPKFQKDHPELKFGDITREIAVGWKGLTDKAKGKFDEMAKNDQVRYQREMAQAQ